MKQRNSSPKRKANRATRQAKRGDAPARPPEVAVLVITAITDDGDLIAEPAKWDHKHKPPHIVVIESGRGPAAGKGDRVLAKLRKIKPQLYQALAIRVLPAEVEQPIVGVFTATGKNGGIIEPVSRKRKESYLVAPGDTNGAKHGELVGGATLPGMQSLGMSTAKITERFGAIDSPRAASLIAASLHQLPSVFSEAALAEAEEAEAPVMSEGREDLRAIPLVTIDGEDARDFDDAVFAEPDGDGFHLIVAIADVAYYVTPSSALDADAYTRGNSVYFPDRVIPMLPERLSNGLCSLKPGEDRYCLAVHLWIDAEGVTKRYKFVRGLMRSSARLTYEQVEASCEGRVASEVDQLATRNSPLATLFAAYHALARERDRRGALDLNLPEYKIAFDEAGNVAAIAPKARLESHRLIEAFMIAANVAAADFLLTKRLPAIYRVHEPPSEEKLEDVRNLLKAAGYGLHVGAGIKAAHFNRVLKASEGEPNAFMIHTSVLRSQMQAYYSHENLGHFGLSLQKYCHFTSPIRRYADLVVHRALVAALEGERLSVSHLPETALHISETERRAMMAERDASDRYKVAFMSRHIGGVFPGVVASVNEYGLFVALMSNGVTGFIPVRNLGSDFYTYDKRHASFKGRRGKDVFAMGQELMIRVQSANAITGSLIFELAKSPAPPERPERPKFRRRR